MTPAPARLSLLAGALITSLLFAAGCSIGGDAAGHSGATSRTAGINDADNAFLRTMVANHRHVIEIAGLARSRSRDPRVRELASRTATERESALTTIKAWLADWGVPAETAAAGGASETATANLTAVSGTEFDRLFVEQMIELWTGAISAADAEVAHGQDPGARQMAKDLTSAYPPAVIDMAQLRTDLGG